MSMKTYKFKLVVHDESNKWSRSRIINAPSLELAVRWAKDAALLWPFGDVQENVGGDEATFIWHEKGLIAELRIVEDD